MAAEFGGVTVKNHLLSTSCNRDAVINERFLGMEIENQNMTRPNKGQHLIVRVLP